MEAPSALVVHLLDGMAKEGRVLEVGVAWVRFGVGDLLAFLQVEGQQAFAPLVIHSVVPANFLQLLRQVALLWLRPQLVATRQE